MARRFIGTTLTWTACLLLPAALALGQFDTLLDGTTAAPAGQADRPVTVSTAWSHDALPAGQSIILAVVLDVRPPFHINAAQPTQSWLTATQVIAKSQVPGLTLDPPLYPPPRTITADYGQGPQALPVYSGRTVIYLPIHADRQVQPGIVPIDLTISWQACDETTCHMPQQVERTVELTIAEPNTARQAIHSDLFADYFAAAGDKGSDQRLQLNFFGLDFAIPANLVLVLLAAAVGGFLLNLTPCVLPMIPLKIMAISATASQRGRSLLYGLLMAAGVVGFWGGLGLVMSLVSEFSATNQLFQQTWFTFTVGLVIAVMALGMFGLFTARLPQWVYRINPRHDTLHGSFGFGVMTAVLSTPCTAPFMGAAASWAVTQQPAVTLATFLAIGAGMALPYAVLSAFPRLVERMPRSGPASELIKQVMGLLMLAAGSYFAGNAVAAWLNRPPDPISRAYWWVVAGFVALAGLWLAWRTWALTHRPLRRALFGGLGLLLVALAVAGAVRLTADSPIHWIYYTPQRLARAQAEGKIVVLEFTAEWCLNCHTLEQLVLHDPQVVALLNRPDVAPIKVDITRDRLAQQKLAQVGRSTIPYLIVYDRRGRVVFDSDAYQVEQLVQAITRAGAS